MASKKAFKIAINRWVADHPDQACEGADRLHLKKLYVAVRAESKKPISIEQAEDAVDSALRRARQTVIHPEKASKGSV